jgi:protein phosphatase
MIKPDISVRWSGWTHPGRFRKNNEDAFLALTFDDKQVRYLGKSGEASLSGGDCVFAVSDGMGGANAGEFASRIAVQKITELMTNSFRLAAAGFRRGGHDFLETLIDQIHAEMRRQGDAYEETSGMGATLTLCWVTPEKIFFAHVGDSRLYFLPVAGGIRQASVDHTHVAWLVRQGKITPTEAKFHPRRNLLQQVLGGGQRSVQPQLGAIEYEPGDRLVLCSDGVTDGLSERAIESLVRTPPPRLVDEVPANRLIREGMDASGRDNLTAIVFEVF